MFDVTEVVSDVIEHSHNLNVIVSTNVGELLECPVCSVLMYPPINQVCLLAELISFIYSILVASY